MNADTDQVIGPLVNGAVLNFATLPTRKLNVRADTNPATVGSVRFGYDANPNFRTENTAPYAFAGDTRGNYDPWTPAVGEHTITATCYAQRNAGGAAGQTLTVRFTVTEDNAPAPTGPVVAGLTIVDADTDTDIGPLADGDTLNLATLPTKNLNVRADTNPATVGSVRFGYDASSAFAIENGAPYSLAGDSGGNYKPWTPAVGEHTITATAYPQRNAGGAAGQTLTVRFIVIEDDAPTGPTVVGLTLVDADTDTDIGPLANGDTLNLATLPTKNLNVRADTNPATVGSVRFGYDASSAFAIENGAPYSLAGDSGGNYDPWTPAVGEHTITATAYPESNAGGAAGPEFSVKFTVSDEEDEEGVLFTDDFEAGNMSKWTTVSNVVVQSTEFASGSFAARAVSTGIASFARYELSNPKDELYARVRFKVISSGANPVLLLQVRTASDGAIVGLRLDGTGNLAIDNSVSGTSRASTTAVTLNEWHEVQLRIRRADSASETEVWYDGDQVAELTGPADLGSDDAGVVQIGDEGAGRQYDVVYDDATVSTDPIPLEPKPEDPGGVSTAPGANQSVLLATYAFTSSRNGGVDWSKVFYLPRQFGDGFTFTDPSWGTQRVDDSGGYAGWDVFPTYNHSVHRTEHLADWCVLEVNRPVTLAVVWRGGAVVPNWLASWSKANDVRINGTTFPTYRKSFSAGRITLGGVYNPGQSASSPRNTYWVLLAEADAKPSPAPAVPGGRERPNPNQTCPGWVHDQYTTIGPDGNVYPTWHHQIDPIYWCYHRHEHGSNPAAFSPTYRPPYSYVASKHGMDEPHAGFKSMVFDDASGNRWMVSMHMGTAGLGRVCNRFHTVGIAVRNKASGELLADLHLMGDFGRAVINTTQAQITPAACPDQAAQALAGGSRGIRQIPSQADGAINYEPWRIDDPRTILGITGTFTVNNPDAIVICNNSSCNQAIATGQSGSKRFFTANDHFGIVAGANSGTFYTDPHGMTLMSAGQPGAVRQYVKPGVSLSVPPGGGTAGHCYDVHAWGKPLVCGANFAQPTNREGSIQPPN